MQTGFSNYLCDSLDHIFNVTANCSNSSNFLLISKPFLNLDRLFINYLYVNGHMAEGPS